MYIGSDFKGHNMTPAHCEIAQKHSGPVHPCLSGLS